jgi:competence protein ComEA
VEPDPPTPWRLLDSAPAVPTTAGGATPTRADVRDESVEPWRSTTFRLAAIGAAILASAAIAIFVVFSSPEGDLLVDGGSGLGSAAPGATDAVGGPLPSAPELIVEIVGGVAAPGVYRLPAGSRIGDLVVAAEGYGPRVDTLRAERELNLAAVLQDGQHIHVPTRDDNVAAAAPAAPAGVGPAAAGPLDLNAATQAELETLPGIGPVLAEKILAAREEARFGSVEELRERGLLGEKTFEGLRELVTVR